MGVTSRTGVKATLRIPVGVTFYDSRIDVACSAADRYVLGLLRQPSGLAVVTATEYPEVYSAAQAKLLLRRRPIVGVAVITNDGAALASTAYRIDTELGELIRIDGGYWSPALDGVKVHYGAGYDADTVPQDVVEAATQLAASFVNRGGQAGLESQDDGAMDVRVSKAMLPPDVSAVLQKYVDW